MEPIDVKRRELIKNISIMAGSAALLSASPWLQNIAAQATSAKKVRLGMIGTGSRGLYHMNLLKNLSDAEMVAICDDYAPNLDAAKAIAPAAKAYTHYLDLLNDKTIDAVIICTPLHLHKQMTVDAFSAGKHVFCEKAMAITIDECVAMVKAQKACGKALQVGHQRMFAPAYLDALKRVKEGEIGQLTQVRAFWHRNNDWRRPIPSPELERKINWRMYLDYSRGLMTELASHHIQVANWFLGLHPDFVMGSGSINFWKDGREVFDNVNLIYHYPNDVHMVYDSLISNVHYELEAQIMGCKGTLEMEKGRIYYEKPKPAPGIVQLIGDVEKKVFSAIPLAGSSWAPETSFDANGTPLIDYKAEDENILQWVSFIETVRSNTFDRELLRQGYDASVACLMGHEAMVSKQPVYWKKEWEFDGM